MHNTENTNLRSVIAKRPRRRPEMFSLFVYDPFDRAFVRYKVFGKEAPAFIQAVAEKHYWPIIRVMMKVGIRFQILRVK